MPFLARFLSRPTMADSEKYYGNEKKVVDVVGVTEYTSDSESQIVAGNAPHGLKRQLKNRHIAMIRCDWDSLRVE